MPKGKLVRDRIPEIISAEGRTPVVKRLVGKALVDALHDKLFEEFGEYEAAANEAEKCDELADVAEVIIALAGHHGCDEATLMELVARKRAERGGFVQGMVYIGDA